MCSVLAKVEERRRARQLREAGWSLRRIAADLDVALSSVSIWVRDIPGPSASRAVKWPPDALPCVRLLVWRTGAPKTCGRCKRLLPPELFNRDGEGRQWWCRSCFRAYFRERGDVHRRQAAASMRARQQRLKDRVLDHLRTQSCHDCGERDLVVLEFDHVGVKLREISDLIVAAAPAAVVDAEIARCEVVCCNCHRRRTARRAGSWRVQRPPDPSAGPRSPRERNVAHVRAVLEESRCVDCGESDLAVLEFDHVGFKRDNVCRLMWNACSIAVLDTEMAACEVRCANCHRRRTAERGGHYRHRAA
jgi:hypothetical protein